MAGLSLGVALSALLFSVQSLTWLPDSVPTENLGIVRGNGPMCGDGPNCGDFLDPPEFTWFNVYSKSMGGLNPACETGFKSYCIVSGPFEDEWDDWFYAGVAPLCPGSIRCQLCPSAYTCVAKDRYGSSYIKCSKGSKALCADRALGSNVAVLEGAMVRSEAISMCASEFGEGLRYVRNARENRVLTKHCRNAIEAQGLSQDTTKCHIGLEHSEEGLKHHDGMMHSEFFSYTNLAEGETTVTGHGLAIDPKTGKWHTLAPTEHAIAICNANGFVLRKLLFGNALDCGRDTNVFDAANFAMTPERAHNLKDETEAVLQLYCNNLPAPLAMEVEGGAVNTTGDNSDYYQENEYGLVWSLEYTQEADARNALNNAVNVSGFGQAIYDRLDPALWPQNIGCTMKPVSVDAMLNPLEVCNGNSCGKGKGKGKGPPIMV